MICFQSNTNAKEKLLIGKNAYNHYVVEDFTVVPDYLILSKAYFFHMLLMQRDFWQA